MVFLEWFGRNGTKQQNSNGNGSPALFVLEENLWGLPEQDGPDVKTLVHHQTSDGGALYPALRCQYHLAQQQQQQPFYRDYPGEPVPEETLTHPPS